MNVQTIQHYCSTGHKCQNIAISEGADSYKCLDCGVEFHWGDDPFVAMKWREKLARWIFRCLVGREAA